ncbi:odorant receptor 63a-like isoform X2 [Linepithema humile]|uniref:odorant receptor 63a-like isoform X2 n=1 Tax=Linepithema humile TaxID=83485 RepID=UPI00351DE6B8
MLVNFQREYNIHKILLSSSGLWPYQSKLISCLFLIPLLVNAIFYNLLEILMLYDYWEDMNIVFDACYQIFALTSIAGRIFNMFWNREQIKRICEAIDNHWNIFTSKLEVQILNDYSIMSRKLTTTYSIFLDMIHPLNKSRSRLFPLTAKFRIDDEKYYTQLYCWIASMVTIMIFAMVAVDNFFLVSIIHAYSLFSIISRQLEEIITKLYVNKDRKFGCCMNTKLELENERIYQKYIISLKKYQLALEFVDMLNSAYKIISLFSLLLSGAILIFAGIQVTNVLEQLGEVMRYTFVIVGNLMQLMLSCYAGQKLRDISQNVFYRAYTAKWYEFPPKLKSLLIITLFRSAAPCSLTAGNMIPLSIETYGLVVRTAGSYFMTFLSLKK